MVYTNYFGRYKVWLNRLQSYLAPLNFIMVLYLYVINDPLGIVWYGWVFLIIIVSGCLLLVDLLLVFPFEQKYISLKNPEWVDLRRDVDELKCLLQKYIDDNSRGVD